MFPQLSPLPVSQTIRTERSASLLMAATMDGMETTAPTDQLAAEHVCVDHIGTQLINIESVQQTIREHVSELESSGMQASVGELKSLLPNLDSLQASLRKTFDAHARPLIRIHHIFAMPNEILRKIFEDVRGEFDDERYEYSSDGVKSIQSLRLTCRRFCEASSHLLLHQLNISLTSLSLVHLDKVSRHPTISKGVRSLKISVALFDPSAVRSLRSFISEVEPSLRFEQLDDMISLHWAKKGVEGDVERAETADRLGKRNEILQSCTKYLHTGTPQPYEDQAMATLSKVYKQYRQLVNDQKALLHANTFATSVTEAVARVPTIAKLSITDLADFEVPTSWTEISSPVYSLVRRILLKPSPSSSQSIQLLGPQPAVLLRQMLLAVVRAGNLLTGLHLCLYFSKESNMELNEEQARDLAGATGKLQDLDTDYRLAIQPVLHEHPSGDSVSKTQLVSVFFNSRKLRSVTLSSGPSMFDDHWEVAPWIAWLPWPTLKKIKLVSFYIHFDELSKFLEKLTPGTCIILEGTRLLSGLWADLLDLIRAKADCHSNVFYPEGCDAVEMGDSFYDKFQSRHGIASVAAAYIRGQITDNPLRSPPDQDNMDMDDMGEEN